MSTGDKKSTTINESGPPEWAQPYFNAFLNRANESTTVPYQAYGGPRIADFTDDQLAGFDLARQQAYGGNPTMDAANQHLYSSLIGGGTFDAPTNPYAGSNPYLNQIIDSAQSDVTRAYSNSVAPGISSAFSSGGAYGGSAHQQAVAESNRQLADQLGQVSTNMRSADYDRQAQLAESAINRQQQAWQQNQANKFQAVNQAQALNSAKYDDARALMNIGSQQQNLWQGLYDQGYQDFNEQRGWEQGQLGFLANALGAINGGTSTQTGDNPNYRSSGQNAAGYAALIASLWG